MFSTRERRRVVLTVCFLLFAAVPQLQKSLRLTLQAEETPSAMDLPSEVYNHQASMTLQKNFSPVHNPLVAMKNQTNSSRPHFVLHVGPLKAISTLLQCRMRHYFVKKAMQRGKDYLFLGKIDAMSCNGKNGGLYQGPVLSAFHTDCARAIFTAQQQQFYNNSNAIHNVTCWRRFLNFMKQAHHQQQNLVVSEEKFSEYHVYDWLFRNNESSDMANLFWDEMTKSLQGWNVTLVVVYRRYYSWLASLKNQGDKYRLGRPRMKLWIGPETQPIFPHLMDMMKHNRNATPAPYVDEILHEYSNRRGFKVTLLNMHDGTNLLDTFFCQILRPTSQVCQLHRRIGNNPNLAQAVYNPSNIPSYDILAVEAKKRGLFQPTRRTKRSDVARAARQYQEQVLGLTHLDFPLICPTSQDLQPLLTKSLEYEQQLFPEFFASPMGEPKLREEFWASVKAKKFCTVHVDQVLADSQWVALFTRVNEIVAGGSDNITAFFTNHSITSAVLASP